MVYNSTNINEKNNYLWYWIIEKSRQMAMKIAQNLAWDRY
jgi:hypothetical protein